MPTLPVTDLEVIEKTSLVNHQGLSYMDFHKNLSPRFGRVMGDIALGYALLFLSLGLCFFLSRQFPRWI